ncbi:MAG: GIY-YIG nuclease family protein, partial [Gemmatimonadota bacterium]
MARTSPVPEWVPRDLPAAPGVYAFTDASGRALYVGKSVDVRRRVRSYFYGGGPDAARLAEMLRIARGVHVHPTGSDLEARLEEADRILADTPPYNRALKRRGQGWYLEARWSEPFPRLRVVRRPRRSGSRYFGPFSGRRLPERIGRLVEKILRLRSCAGPVRPDPGATPCIQHELGLCTAPCARRAGIDEYRRQVRHAVRLLSDPAYGWT